MTEDNRLTMENPSGEGSEYSSPVSEAAQGQPAPETQLQESLAEENRSPVSEAVQEQPMQKGFAEENSSPAPGMAQEQATEGQSLQDPGTVASCHPVAEFRGLTKKYGSLVALNGVSFQIGSGRIVGLLGPNGSGKTTMIKLINGLLKPNKGEVLIDGLVPGPETAKLVSYLPDRNYLDGDMTFQRACKLFSTFYQDFDENKAKEMLQALHINPKSRFKTLSKGNRDKAQLILVMSRRAKLYVLDEPIAGVDPAARDYILNTIVANYNPNATILISTHLISDVEKILDDVLFLKNGEVALYNSADEVRREHGKSVDEVFREVFAC